MTLKKGNLLEFRLLAPVTNTSATFRMAAAPIMKRADGSYYDLNFNNDSTISITNFRATFIKTDGTIEVFSVDGVALDGTTSDGRRIYVCTVEIAADASTKMRGIMQDDDGTNAVSNLDSDLVIGTMDVGETVKIAWDISSENLLTGSFTAASTTEPVQAGEALDASSGTLGLSLHTDGKYYKYESGSKADLQGLLPRGQNIALDATFTITWLNGIVTTESGLTADTLYHVQDGGTLVTTATSTTRIAGKSRGTTILVGNQDQSIPSLTDGAVTTGTATVPSLATAAQLKLAVNTFAPAGSLASIGMCDEFSIGEVVGLAQGNNTAGGATTVNLGRVSSEEKYFFTVVGNGVAGTTIDFFIQKVGSPTDNFTVEVFADNGAGRPTGSALFTAVKAGGTVTGTLTQYSLSFGSITLDKNKPYHIQIRRSGAINASNYFVLRAYLDEAEGDFGKVFRYQGGWSDGVNQSIELIFGGTAFAYKDEYVAMPISTHFIDNVGDNTIKNFVGFAQGAGVAQAYASVLYDGVDINQTGKTIGFETYAGATQFNQSATSVKIFNTSLDGTKIIDFN